MQSWHTTYLGLKDLPRELSSFELQAFFTFRGLGKIGANSATSPCPLGF